MIPEYIIKLAIEGGWIPTFCTKEMPWSVKWLNEFWYEVRRTTSYIQGEPFDEMKLWPSEKAICDPLFWSSLGKKLGWDVAIERFRCPNEACESMDTWLTKKHCQDCGKKLESISTTSSRWKNQAIVFFDLLLTNGDTGAFWSKIAPNK